MVLMRGALVPRHQGLYFRGYVGIVDESTCIVQVP